MDSCPPQSRRQRETQPRYDAEHAMHRRARLSLIIFVAVLAALLLAAIITARMLLKPARFTAMLQQYASGAGLVLAVDAGAEPELWPRPAVHMQGLRLSVAGNATPVLSASEGRLVVPWRSLLGGAPAISQLRLRSPRVDLGQLRALFDRQPTEPSTGAPTIPDIDAGIHIRDGQLLQGNAVLLQDVDLTTGAFGAGRPFDLQWQARSASGRPISVRLSAIPTQKNGQLALGTLQLHIASGDQASVQLSGHLDWRGGARLDGELHGPLVVADNHYATTLTFVAPLAGAPLHVQLGLDGDATHVALNMAPTQLVQWWQGMVSDTPTALALPPLQGRVQTDKLDVGSMHVEGLRIDSGPAPASSTAPAAAASVVTP